MDDLAVGTKFYYKGSLCKVFEAGHEYDYDKCSRCDMSLSECSIMNCASESREDGKSVYFKWIEDTENTTFYGAWNVVLDYLTLNRPNAKIGIIVESMYKWEYLSFVLITQYTQPAYMY